MLHEVVTVDHDGTWNFLEVTTHDDRVIVLVIDPDGVCAAVRVRRDANAAAHFIGLTTARILLDQVDTLTLEHGS